MSGIGANARSFESPDEQVDKGRVHIEVIDLGGLKVKRQTYPPGWRFSTDMGQPRCNDTHVGYALSGQVHVVLEGGEELDIRAGDVFVIPPGHDAWTEEGCSMVQFDEGASASRRFNIESRSAKAA